MTKTSVRKRLKEWKNSLKVSGRSPNKSPLSSPTQSHASLQSSLDKPNPQQPSDLLSSSPDPSHSLTVPHPVANISPSAPATVSQTTTAAIAPPAVEVLVSPIIVQQPVPINLWEEAFRQANDETQTWIRNNGLNLLEQAKSEDLAELIKNKSKCLSEGKGSPSKIEIGSQKIVFREYVSDIVTFLTMAGELAINFAPPQAGVPWAVAKALLRIPVKHIEQMAAIAGTVQLFARIVQRGQVYEHLYNATTADEEAVSNLRDALRDLYIAAIELLARSDVLVEGGLVKQTLNAILRPEQASGLVSDLLMKEQKVSLEAQVCEASRSAKAGLKMDETIEALLTNLDKLSTPISRIDKGVDNLLEEVEKDRLERLMDFISSEKFGKGHVTIRESRIQGTGDWLIKHEGLRDWQAISSASTLLCLKGTVGTGKTYLTSRVIDHIKQTLETSTHDEGFAFFYCNRSGPSMLDPMVVLRSFVRQLSYKAYHYNHIQTSVIQKCQLAKQEGRDLSFEDCKELILGSLNLYPKTTLILDALDESEISTYNLAEILIELTERATKPVKVFISSRPDREYLKAFEDKCIITVDSNNQKDDIAKFLHQTLYSQPFFNRRKAEIQKIIKETFTSRNGGMFRWVYLQVKSLLKCISDDAVKAWARTIPRDLMAAYDQLWENIRAQHNEDDVALAERAVKWVLCAFEPLQSDVLLEAVRYSLERDGLVQKERHSKEEILLLCQDLLTIDAERRAWMLPHASVAEYFESRGMTLAICDVFASITSLNFLMRPELQPSQIQQKDYNFDTFEAYISYTWPRHVQRYDRCLGSIESADPDQILVTTLKRFLGSVEESSNYYRAWLRKLGSSMSWELKPADMSLFVMCRYGFYYILRDWWEGGKINEEMALEKYRGYMKPEYYNYKRYPDHNSVDLAAKGGCLPIFKYLVGVIGSDNPLAEGHSRAMEWAIDQGNKDIVSILVEEAKVDVNMCYLRDTAVQHAAIFGHTEMLQWLVDQGWVDVDREGGNRVGNALIAAATCFRVGATEILIKAGADVNAAVECGLWGSALVAACTVRRYDCVEKIRLLLSHGADPNQPIKSGQYGSALEAVIVTASLDSDGGALAASIKSLEVLLEAGADPAIITDWGDHGSALAAAACCGFIEFLKMMIDVTGREKAIECLGQSRCTGDLYLRDEEHVERWRQAKTDTVAYLTNQVGVENETLYSIGLRDVEPEKEVDSCHKFVVRYD
ncbi:hypothetical protein CFAM422_004932 [Trichoderma lentiforme]|uniref:Nephrocystin 3-like N-terminal domain-containing protein n=1 Tax=Trichoderma lentiforme TaxID=1567552 RepID=A0A9P4XH34_9HYPO|nr:hypothetical protein CFAM422_004932 [Trichoderma lentiforme]